MLLMRVRQCLIALCVVAGPAAARAQVFGTDVNQRSAYFGLETDQTTAHIGDVVKVKARLHLGMQQELVVGVPQIQGDIPDGVRVLSVDSLRKQKDGAFQSEIRLAFYRIGLQQVPDFRAIVRRYADPMPIAAQSDIVTIQIQSILPAGDQSLKDIRGLAKVGAINWWPIVGGVLFALVAIVLWSRRRRPAPPPIELEVMATPPVPTALEEAMARLDALTADDLDDAGTIANRYAAVAAILHDYFVTTAQIEPGATTTRVLSVLARLPDTDPLRRRTGSVLSSADLVKFARARPAAAEARGMVASARDLLPEWDRTLAPVAAAVESATAQEADVPAR